MAKLIVSQNVFTDSSLTFDSSSHPFFTPNGKNLGCLPTLYGQDGQFIDIVNSWFFDLKAVKHLVDLSSYSRALRLYWSFLEEQNLEWNSFPPIKRLKPTYQFRHHLITLIEDTAIAHSTANHYLSHVVQFYIWAIHDNYLNIENENTAPFCLEFIDIKRNDKLAHLKKKFTVQTSDLRIRVPKVAHTNNVNTMNALSREDLKLVANKLLNESIEFRLQCLLGLQCGLRINEISTLTVDAINQAIPLTENKSRYSITIGLDNGVQTKYKKTRKIEISYRLLITLKNYSISERYLKRLKKLKHKQLNVIQNLPNHKMRNLERSIIFTPLFISNYGNPTESKVISARWADFRKNVRMIDLSFNHKFHDLRCTYGTYRLNDLLQSNIDTSEALDCIMSWMGHNHEQTTWKYLRYLKRKEILLNQLSLLDEIMHDAVNGDVINE